MKKSRLKLMGVLSLVLIVALSISACEMGDDTTEETVPEEANFVVEIDEEESILDVDSGDEVTLVADVQNQGDEEDEQDIVLSIYDKDYEEVLTEDFQERSLELDAGESDTVEFSYNVTRPSETVEVLEVRSEDDLDTAELIIRAPEAEMEGQVLIEGEEPDMEIEMRLDVWDYGEEEAHSYFFNTEEDGSYVIPDEYYITGDMISVYVDGSEVYDDYAEENINRWTFISWFTVEGGEHTLPELDLYNYGFEFIEPEDGEEIELPYTVDLGEYDREAEGVEDGEYYLSIFDLDWDRLGNSETYDEPIFEFDGSLDDGTELDQDAYWRAQFRYEVEGYTVYIYSPFNTVYLED